MTSTNIDYVKTYFDYPVLTKIHGEPTYESLQEIKDQLKTNAATVTSRLGGGANGHLGLVLTPLEYARVNAIPYTRPEAPQRPEIIQGNAQHENLRLNQEYQTAQKEFRETVDMEKALIKQIVQAIEPKYLKILRNSTTNAITRNIPDILEYLFSRYGRVDPETLHKKELSVRQMQYNLQEPLVVVYEEVEELEKLAEAAGNPYTPIQVVNFGLQIIKNTKDFEDGIKAWNALPLGQKNWMNFKLHFEKEHRALKEIRGATMQSTAFHQVNYIAEQVLQEVRNVQTTVMDQLTHIPIDSDKENEAPQYEHQANAAKSADTVQMEMLKLIKDLQLEVRNMKSNNYSNNGYNNNNNNGGNRSNGKRNRTKYCWTHGACAHDSKDCNPNTRAPGHQDDATMANKMGGSTKNCGNN
jgi:hypothetical protein